VRNAERRHLSVPPVVALEVIALAVELETVDLDEQTILDEKVAATGPRQ
jgi:hypothetical protein